MRRTPFWSPSRNTPYTRWGPVPAPKHSALALFTLSVLIVAWQHSLSDHLVMPCVQVSQRQGAFILEVCHVWDLFIPVTGHPLTAGCLSAQATLALYQGHLLPNYLYEETGMEPWIYLSL